MSEPAEMQQFLAALGMPGDVREPFVAAIQPPALQQRVRDLLAAHARLGDSDPAPELAPASEAAIATAIGSDTAIDGFRILHELGRGGMGVVFAAEQLEPPRRVALKTLSPGRSHDIATRLEREARTLARLSHPGIAHVYGSGRIRAHGDVPFLVMELVLGHTLDDYLRDRDPNRLTRLRLLAELGEAVAHAHDRGVVHRDLKPSNVMVTNDGRVKVLDFGIARVVDSEDPRTRHTRSGQVLGTLAYMSPERLALDDVEPDASCDVYALGVLCYEVLTGRLPIELAGASFASAVRRIQEIEPPLLGAQDRSLRGDLELVVRTAMAKDPDRRYANAGQFAAELRRVLAHQPVLARAPTRFYLLRKFVRRHRASCAAAGGIAAALILGLGWSLLERDAAMTARATTEEALTLAQRRGSSQARMIDLLWSVMAQATPDAHGGTPPTVDVVVGRLANEVDARFADDPFVLGNTHLLLFDVAHRRDDLDAMAHHLERAADCFDSSALARTEQRIDLAARRSRLLHQRGSRDEAIAVLEHALAQAQAVRDNGLRLGQISTALANLLVTVRRDLERAETLAERGVELARPHDTDGSLTATRRQVLARALDARDATDRAIAVYEQIIAHERATAPDSVGLAVALQNLGHLHSRQAELDRALPLLEEALRIRRRIYGDTPHSSVAIALDNLATVWRDRGDLDLALRYFDTAIPIFEETGGGPELAVALTERAMALRQARRFDAARLDLDRAIAIFDHGADTATPAHAAALEQLAVLHCELQQAAEAVPLAERAVAMRRAIHGPAHHLVARGLETLGLACFVGGDLERTEQYGREAMRLRRDFYGRDHWMVFAAGWLVWVPLVRREAYDEALALLRAADHNLGLGLGAGHARHRRCLADLRDTLTLAGRPEEAAAVAQRITGFDESSGGR